MTLSGKLGIHTDVARTPKPPTARYQRVGDDWIVTAGRGRAARAATGRTLLKARAAIVDVLAQEQQTYGGAIVLEDDVVLPAAVSDAIARARAAREAALTAAAEARDALAHAVTVLAEHGLSTRDAGYLLGISHARVQQIDASNPT